MCLAAIAMFLMTFGIMMLAGRDENVRKGNADGVIFLLALIAILLAVSFWMAYSFESGLLPK